MNQGARRTVTTTPLISPFRRPNFDTRQRAQRDRTGVAHDECADDTAEGGSASHREIEVTSEHHERLLVWHAAPMLEGRISSPLVISGSARRRLSRRKGIAKGDFPSIREGNPARTASEQKMRRSARISGELLRVVRKPQGRIVLSCQTPQAPD